MPTEYQIVKGETSSEIESLIRKELGCGWSLQGGLAIDAGPSWTILYQAMVRNTPDSNQEAKASSIVGLPLDGS